VTEGGAIHGRVEVHNDRARVGYYIAGAGAQCALIDGRRAGISIGAAQGQRAGAVLKEGSGGSSVVEVINRGGNVQFRRQRAVVGDDEITGHRARGAEVET